MRMVILRVDGPEARLAAARRILRQGAHFYWLPF
jgi:hypothetical protein